VYSVAHKQIVQRAKRLGITSNIRKAVRDGTLVPATALEAFSIGIPDFEPHAAKIPTTSDPGTPARVAVYAARMRRGYELWHPEDKRLPTAEPTCDRKDSMRGVVVRGRLHG
jgi:hypothetical protein